MNIDQTSHNLGMQMYKELFIVTDKCYSSMDSSHILSQIIETLERVLPEYEPHLLLSHDEQVDPNLPVKSLEFNTENEFALSAYVNATVQIDDAAFPSFYAPLQGKQGVYGVLQVQSFISSSFDPDHQEFIRLIANIAGNALENAKLYQQSQTLIDNLRLIDEITQKLNSISTYKETVVYLKKQVKKIFRASGMCYIILKNEKPIILKDSTDIFHRSVGKRLVELVLDHTEDRSESLFIGQTTEKFEDVAEIIGSFMSVPFQTSSIQGWIILTGEKPLSFTFEQFRLFQSLVQRSALGLSNVILREKLEKMVITDYLTKLYTRNYLDNAIKQSMKQDRQGTFILIDLDDFKLINDQYGHQIGDQVLIQVAKLIKEYIRPTDIAARWGGEELAIYLPSVGLDNGIPVAQRLLKCVSEQTNPPVTMSCGITNWTYEKPDEVTHLFSRADSALYDAKAAGKNQIRIKPA